MRFLYETVKEILDTGRLGIPVFVRCSAQIGVGGEQMEDVLARILAMTCSWLESVPLKVYAQEGRRSRQLTATAHLVGGQTAIVSVNTAPGAGDSMDLILLGNKGAIYHDAESIPPGFDINDELIPVPEWLVEAMRESFRTGKPAAIEEVLDHE